MFRGFSRWLLCATNVGGAKAGANIPTIVQLPARNLWCRQFPIDVSTITSKDFQTMVTRLRDARKHFQYPSLCAPQIGWNARVLVLFDDSVWINPEVLSMSATDAQAPAVPEGHRNERGIGRCWAWEACASCSFLMHYIERPFSCSVRAVNDHGEAFGPVDLDGMRCRTFLHEMDHMEGRLFTRRIPNADHAIPLDGFHIMSDWADDYPSIEARSTFINNIYAPPTTMLAEALPDARFMDRKYEDGIYPGMEINQQMSVDERRQDADIQEIFRDNKRRDAAKQRDAAAEKPFVEDKDDE